MTWTCQNTKQNGEVCGNVILQDPYHLWLQNNRSITVEAIGELTAHCPRCDQKTTYVLQETENTNNTVK
jgi:hypothetical protein